MPALEMEDTRANGFNSSPAHSPGRDLSPQLLEAGWRKFFSKREQRPYFFNKFTNQSLWDEPTLGVSAYLYVSLDIKYCSYV